MTAMPTYTTRETIPAPGSRPGVVHVIAEDAPPDPSALSGTDIMLDGKATRVRAVEVHMVALPYPRGLPWAVLVDAP